MPNLMWQAWRLYVPSGEIEILHQGSYDVCSQSAILRGCKDKATPERVAEMVRYYKLRTEFEVRDGDIVYGVDDPDD